MTVDRSNARSLRMVPPARNFSTTVARGGPPGTEAPRLASSPLKSPLRSLAGSPARP
jgi:hypothetical protein